MSDTSQRDHPIVILIRGLPGSGKSYLARALSRELGEDDVVMLDPDATDYESDIYKEHVRQATADVRLQAEEHRTRLPILVVEVGIDDAIAKQRVDERKSQGGHGPSDGTFQRFVGDYESFKDEGYDTVAVSGQYDVKVSVAKVLAALDKLQEK
jgi:thymidylate kinase